MDGNSSLSLPLHFLARAQLGRKLRIKAMRGSNMGTGSVASFLPTILYLLSLVKVGKGQTRFNQPKYDSWGTAQLPFEIPTSKSCQTVVDNNSIQK